ncbi:hypothetical protein ANCCEY_02315 [Ancylostoma ceylanicum]|uniref:PAS domain-containing protein n=1 Tax=Ancylostoma ceylanicum TaxID=53326 RepID=A0A0D6M2V7_9BILA|nr:hypothetical protein ANCCEY_02315 [Ancylostoma ceylanicum]
MTDQKQIIFREIDSLKQALPVSDAILEQQALDGFCFILDDRYRILYITESVSTHLGFSQVQMVGCCMSEFVHPEDFSVLNHVMSINVGVPQTYTQKLESSTQFTLRMTSKLPKRSCGFMFAGYKNKKKLLKTILCTGFVRGVAVNGIVRGDILLASGQMIDRPGLPELTKSYFRVGEILHFNPTDLLDRTLYHLITVEDCESLLRAHMMSKAEL